MISDNGDPCEGSDVTLSTFGVTALSDRTVLAVGSQTNQETDTTPLIMQN
jgi:hypothetical protein